MINKKGWFIYLSKTWLKLGTETDFLPATHILNLTSQLYDNLKKFRSHKLFVCPTECNHVSFVTTNRREGVIWTCKV